MSSSAFGVVAFCALLGTIGALVAFNPRAIARMTTAYYALMRMKSRFAEEDYDTIEVK